MNYLILAMKRSGHHAIMNWISAHTGQKQYNNCCFGWEDKKFLTMIGKKEAKDGIVNIEDFYPVYYNKHRFETFPFMQNCKTVLVMRSASNWLASCYKRKYSNREDHKDVYYNLTTNHLNDRKELSSSSIDIYCEQLSWILEKKDLIVITFDDWFKNKEYRKKMAEQLGFEFNEEADKEKEKVAMNGNGSSFDKMKYDLEASKMKVLSRSQEILDPEFKTICKFAFDQMQPYIKGLSEL